MLGDDVRRLMELYPKIFFACHTRHVRDPATQKVVSAHQVQILDHLDSEEPTGLVQLARHMGVTAGTMSVAIDRLVRGGYVRRERDTADARRVNLRLTPAGARVRQESSVLEPERVRALLSELDRDQRAQGLAGLELLADAAQHIMSSGRPDGLDRQVTDRLPK